MAAKEKLMKKGRFKMTYNPFGGGFNSSYLDMATDLEILVARRNSRAGCQRYAEANMKAAEKTNPMNAESQTPVKIFFPNTSLVV